MDENKERTFQGTQSKKVRRAAENHKKVRRNQRLNSRLRWALPAMVSAILIGILAWPQLELLWIAKLKPKKAELSFDRLEHRGHVMGPHYHAKNKQDQPYDLKAESAVVVGDDKIELQQPSGTLALNPAHSITLQAKKGVYRQDQKNLKLEGGVQLKDNQGNLINFEASEIDLDKGEIKSNSPIRGEGPLGEIQAQSFEVRDQGKLLIFKGRAQIVIMPHQQDKKEK